SRMERTAAWLAIATPGRMRKSGMVAYAATGMIPISAFPPASRSAQREGIVYSTSKSLRSAFACGSCSKFHISGAVFRKLMAETRRRDIQDILPAEDLSVAFLGCHPERRVAAEEPALSLSKGPSAMR